jgi:hypothetical protein
MQVAFLDFIVIQWGKPLQVAPFLLTSGCRQDGCETMPVLQDGSEKDSQQPGSI